MGSAEDKAARRADKVVFLEQRLLIETNKLNSYYACIDSLASIEGYYPKALQLQKEMSNEVVVTAIERQLDIINHIKREIAFFSEPSFLDRLMKKFV